MSTEGGYTELTQRQLREQAYHKEFAWQHRNKVEEKVPLDVIQSGPRRPWNCYWSCYDVLMAHDITGKKVLVPGSGLGDDAIRLALLGAQVYASDLSPDLTEIARARAKRSGAANIYFDVMPAETLTYPNDFFDLVFFNDILHHVSIATVLVETQRVMKPGGTVVANELYTHSTMQKLRESRFVSHFFYGRMAPFIYGKERPYITEDERKLDEHDVAALTTILQPDATCSYFLMLSGRLFPQSWTRIAKLDRIMLALVGRAGYLLAGRVLVVGKIH